MCMKHNFNAKFDFNSKESIKELFEMQQDKLYENTEKNKEIAKQIIKAEDEFYESLTEEEKLKFEKLNDLKLRDREETDCNIFVYAFILASRLIIESIV